EQCVDDFLALDMPRFFSWRSHRFFPNSPIHQSTNLPIYQSTNLPIYQFTNPQSPTFLHTTYTGPKFAPDVTGRLWEGGTVTYVCLQLAFYMGFEQAILIGVDHSFASQGEPNTTVTSNGDDPDHFDGRYFGKGFRWQLPDLASSEAGYRMAQQAYESAGREVVDATVGGKLQIFPKVEYGTLFE
ncbi:MAG: hypothetical protein KJ638_01725, partial [Chloroflexi bacterium]|nr:hypothetical protein [Chloroflexota bacterium]